MEPTSFSSASLNRREFIKSGVMAATAVAVPTVFSATAQSVAPDSDAERVVLRQTFANPPREFGLTAFWFWNDDLNDAEIRRQIGELHAKGFGGFVIHPRTGLSRRVGYLTDEFFRLVTVAVEEAARLGLQVVLYDEAGYPAGAVNGAIVAEHPEWAAKAIFAVQHTVTGPKKGFWRPSSGRSIDHQLLSVVAGRLTGDNAVAPESLRRFSWNEQEVVAYDLPAGEWRFCSVWGGPSGGTTRGAFPEQEDDHATAPPAADILRRDVVDRFIELTHEKYHARLKEHFGRTITAIFTDEPSPRGRIASPERRAHLHAWTPGFLERLQKNWEGDVNLWLPALWIDCGPRTADFRLAYHKTEQALINEAFYQPVSQWCERHGIALTGHCANSNEMGTLRYFQWPGQDLVWRMVVPGNKSAFEGPDSLVAKASSSAARQGRRRFNANEVFGAYGWQLTLDEVKWLLDWLFVRGTNRMYLHAAFYSVRGRRAFESEPDLTFHNAWWPYFGAVGDYGRRMSWLLTDSELVAPVGVLSDGDILSWSASSILQRRQCDFIFVDAPGLAAGVVRDGALLIGDHRVKLLVVDRPGPLTPAAAAKLAEFERSGGRVLRDWTPEDLAPRCAAAVGSDVIWRGTEPDDLRVAHLHKSGLHFFVLVNEGEQAIDGDVELSVAGRVEKWDCWDGSIRPWPGRKNETGGVRLTVRLNRRESCVFAVDPGREPEPRAVVPKASGAILAAVNGPWTVTRTNGETVPLAGLQDWAQVIGWETFAGTLCYRTTFQVPNDTVPRFIDLGRVGDIADVRVNGMSIGVQRWAPYVGALGDAVRPGENQLEIRVTNSSANKYYGRQLPSGLMGPVTLRAEA
jgi:hypothetical protein